MSGTGNCSDESNPPSSIHTTCPETRAVKRQSYGGWPGVPVESHVRLVHAKHLADAGVDSFVDGVFLVPRVIIIGFVDEPDVLRSSPTGLRGGAGGTSNKNTIVVDRFHDQVVLEVFTAT